jgi:hypothetical protein
MQFSLYILALASLFWIDGTVHCAPSGASSVASSGSIPVPGRNGNGQVPSELSSVHGRPISPNTAQRIGGGTYATHLESNAAKLSSRTGIPRDRAAEMIRTANQIASAQPLANRQSVYVSVKKMRV